MESRQRNVRFRYAVSGDGTNRGASFGLLRPNLTDQWIALRVLDRLYSQIHIKIRPIEVMRLGKGDMRELPYGSIPEPREIFKGEE